MQLGNDKQHSTNISARWPLRRIRKKKKRKRKHGKDHRILLSNCNITASKTPTTDRHVVEKNWELLNTFLLQRSALTAQNGELKTRNFFFKPQKKTNNSIKNKNQRIITPSQLNVLFNSNRSVVLTNVYMKLWLGRWDKIFQRFKLQRFMTDSLQHNMFCIIEACSPDRGNLTTGCQILTAAPSGAAPSHPNMQNTH